ncbi:MAG TPA: bifunctional precorrin-2 dehydrogenase/sirohydrochlorin ferrochelatase [Acidimicrobiales bacterium]|nr:bifunctional precorrin-2 dehydrogenase/sirohydrochlorin ferrochelatase [Acidimicrobiales bacterium]
MPVAGSVYPVNLIVAGRRCLVVGGGPVAARKAAALVEAGAEVTVVAPRLCDEVRSLPVRLVERAYRAEDLDGAWLAIAATDDPAVNRRLDADGRAARVWVNAADDPEACSFTLPAVLRRGPVTVAVSTAGHSPALAGWLKEQIASQLGPEIAELAEMLSDARDELKAAGRSTEDVDWRRALNSDMLDLIRKGQLARARERLQACL